MIEIHFLNEYAPIFVMLVSFILCYAALKLLKVPGNDFTLVILSALLAIILISSASSVNYLFNLIPLLSVIMLAAFIGLVALALVAKDIGTFKKPLAWIGFALIILVGLGLAFNSFHTLNHLLPNTSDSGLNRGLIELKDFIYSDDFKNGFLLIVSVIIVGVFMLKGAKK